MREIVRAVLLVDGEWVSSVSHKLQEELSAFLVLHRRHPFPAPSQCPPSCPRPAADAIEPSSTQTMVPGPPCESVSRCGKRTRVSCSRRITFCPRRGGMCIPMMVSLEDKRRKGPCCKSLAETFVRTVIQILRPVDRGTKVPCACVLCYESAAERAQTAISSRPILLLDLRAPRPEHTRPPRH